MGKKNFIILIESATLTCSVALSNSEVLVAEKYISESKVQDKMLASLVEELLKENSISVKECSAIAVSSGPGSYMGLRIGTSLAKGLAYGASIPLIAVNTLAVIAQCTIDNGLAKEGVTKIVPMIDAGRMEVYTATFNLNMEELSSTAAKILESNSFADELEREKIVFTGDGAAKFEKFLKEKALEDPAIAARLKNATFTSQLPHASGLRIKAAQAIKNSKYESTAYFEPFYLKDFIPGKPKKLL